MQDEFTRGFAFSVNAGNQEVFITGGQNVFPQEEYLADVSKADFNGLLNNQCGSNVEHF